MRLWVLSDLHLRKVACRTGEMPPIVPEADVAVVAGDVVEGIDDAMVWLARTITTRMPVVFCLGNHEFFGEYHEEARRRARAWADRISGLYLLDDSAALIDGVRFLGCTLWTDYMLFAHGERALQQQAMRTAAHRMSDHRQILREPARPGWMAPMFNPADALQVHQASVAWLDAEFVKQHDGKTVVVTHHAPHSLSVAKRWAEDATTPAFVSDLGPLIESGQPELWVHGHTHTAFDYEVKPVFGGRNTRVICNARGYCGENPAFRWDLVIEI
ncbi:metallophosphoesterase [Chelatococcus sambhunathii]|uniref:Metallophosphoesterase n=1 Tax=Chelatococcus sambhunathii TaxID=363953 RepID=A0ABU1DCW8_9HYPH|nr:metallophosphoesterase [Chelatococcus sambhunathii]MDR4305951.1 metallophosphoesterase [Chelatococcus sambhunathii]